MFKVLNGYHNTNPELTKPGIVIDWGGRSYDLMNFDPSTLSVDDIARQLSRMNRYNGNTNRAYNVAQHTVMGCQALILCGMIDEAYQFWGHDISETITNDVNPIIKKQLGDQWASIEDDIQCRFAKYYGFTYPYDPVVHRIDKNLASFEISMLIRSEMSCDFDYWGEDKSYDQFKLMYYTIRELLHYKEVAEKL